MDPVTVACVLKSGGEYRGEHVAALYHGIAAHWMPLRPLDVVVLTDLPPAELPQGLGALRVIPLRYDWSGWWSKMELFRPSFEGDFLYFDLDTVIVGDLTDLVSVNRLTVLRDLYHGDRPERRHRIGSGLMFIPAAERAAVWHEWIRHPIQHMQVHANRGDQAFLETLWRDTAARWQDVVPSEQICSYKVSVRPTGRVPVGTRVVCYHGQPRPWDAPLPAAC